MMKKILFFLLLAVFTLGISAQAPSKKCPVCGLSIPKCQYKGKHPKKKPTTTAPAKPQPSKPAKQPAKPTPSKPKPITVSRPTGTNEGHGYVDLGLSVKWATQNVGADSPSDYGGCFAWGRPGRSQDTTGATALTALTAWATVGALTRLAARRASARPVDMTPPVRTGAARGACRPTLSLTNSVINARGLGQPKVDTKVI